MRSLKKANKISKVVTHEAYIQAQIVDGNTGAFRNEVLCQKRFTVETLKSSPKKATKIDKKLVNKVRQNTAYRPKIT